MKRFFFSAIVSTIFAFAQEPRVSSNLPAGLTNPASLEGRVIDTSGIPLRKVILILRANGPVPQSSYSTTSDAEGKFSFDEIASGSYMLSADRAGYLQKAYRASPHETSTRLTFIAGQHVKEITLTMTRAVTISGEVLDADGDPVANAQVSVLRRTYSSGPSLVLQRSASTDTSGRYNIPDLGAGQYYLSASGGSNSAVFFIAGMRAVSALPSSPLTNPGRAPRYYTTTYYPSEIDQHAAVAIQVIAGQDDIQGLNIVLRKTPAFMVKGKVVGAIPGYPLEQCRITLTSADLPSTMGSGLGFGGVPARTAKDGSFDFQDSHFAPGIYFLTALWLPGLTRILARQQLIISSREIDDAVLNLQPLAELRGAVSIEGQQHTNFSAYPGSNLPPTVTMQVGLSVMNVSMPNGLSGRIKDDGSFSISDIAPGTYGVRVSGTPSGTYVKSIRLGSREVMDNGIDITGNLGGTSLEVTLSQAMGQIEGVVLTDRGMPAGDSSVTLVGEAYIPSHISMLTGVNENGRFTLPTVPPGTYRLYAWEDLEVAQHYDPDFLKPFESQSVSLTVKESAREQVILRQIPSAPEPHQQ